MRILIAPDKFKGSLSAPDVARAVSNGIKQKYPNAAIDRQPMADGGDGSIDLLCEVWDLQKHEITVRDPLFRPILAPYFSNKEAAFIELPLASGYALLNKEERNPLKTSTIGTGDLIKDAVEKGFKKINLFIGGSSTNDAAVGIAGAIGFRFFDDRGKELLPIGENLVKIQSIMKPLNYDEILSLQFQVICDVTNPFYGKNGAAHVYAKQKGAAPGDIELLDRGLRNIDEVFQNSGLGSVADMLGAGAAGGVGGGMKAFFNAKPISGIQFFIDIFDIEKRIERADFVVTGEGQLDSQSLQGKVVGGLLKICRKHEKPLFVVCGKNALPEETTGLTGVFSVLEKAGSLEKAMKEPKLYLEEIGGELPFTDQLGSVFLERD